MKLAFILVLVLSSVSATSVFAGRNRQGANQGNVFAAAGGANKNAGGANKNAGGANNTAAGANNTAAGANNTAAGANNTAAGANNTAAGANNTANAGGNAGGDPQTSTTLHSRRLVHGPARKTLLDRGSQVTRAPGGAEATPLLRVKIQSRSDKRRF